MRAGRLRHKVTLMSPTASVSALGEIETSHTNLGTFYAEVIGKAASEMLSDGALASTTAFTINMRFNSTDLSDIPPAAYLVFEGRNLKILSSDMADYRDRMVRIQAEEVR